MTKVIGIIVVVLLATFLVACKTSSKATIYNNKSEVLKVVEDSASVKEIIGAWKAKERALEKLMPLFEYKIEMDIDGDKQVWRVNKAGYLMQEGDSILYKTPQKAALAKYLN
ncbi:MAG: hypothetical protein HWE16_15375 [Gammaproteobacteria bacterium]|nr:hypothetical protein [Gammaproteobacteria bacterium]